MGLLLKRFGVAATVFVISATAMWVASWFVFVAIYFGFREILSPPLAALATAGALVGFAILVIVVGWLVLRSMRRKPRPDFDWLLDLVNAPDGLSAAAIGNAIGRRLRAFALQNSKATIIASLIAGLALGISPGLRALFRDWLRD